MIRFTKMHGIGNDYLYLDAFAEPALAIRTDLPELSERMSDRHRGVGSDGLILVSAPTPEGAGRSAQARMRMFNADGSEGEMCGNGVRCVAKLAVDREHVRPIDGKIHVETGAGVLPIQVHSEGGIVTHATVNMGAPILELAKIPVDQSKVTAGGQVADATEWRVDDFNAIFVSMGNPHMVVFFDEDPGDELLLKHGPRLERHSAFPRRVNAHFVHTQSPTEGTMRTWERGSGRTLACGTGACAVLVAGALSGRLSRDATLHLPGGDLRIRWEEASNHVFMTGPAEEIFSGDWPE